MKTILIEMKLLVYLIIITSFSCQSNKNAKPIDHLTFDDTAVTKPKVYNNTNSSYLKIIGDSVEIPPFIIDLDLSKRAEDTLKAQHESVKVIAFFSGEPKRFTKQEINNGEEDRFLCSREIELFNSRTAEFKNIKFPKKLYNSLADKDIFLLVNVYSGRRSSNINILSCGIIAEKMSLAKNMRFTIIGRLIEEPRGDF